MMLRLVALSLFIIASLATRATDYGIVGLWRVTGPQDCEFEIRPSSSVAGSYDMLAVNCADMSVMPGTLIGTLHTTPTPGRFLARISSHPERAGARKVDVVVNLGNEGNLTFRAFRKGKRISLWRLLPYMFRITVEREDARPEGVDGAVRVGQGDLTRFRVL
ncbi:MAG: hypothetical protein K2L99_02505 [Muribaculaceae bacterium]|nr:hypothetical protein [Muribaculaceae bacterium]